MTSDLERQTDQPPSPSGPTVDPVQPADVYDPGRTNQPNPAEEVASSTEPNTVQGDIVGALNSVQGAQAESELAPPFYSLDPRHIRVEQIGGMIVIGLISVGMVVGLLIAAFSGMGFSLLWFGCVAAATLLAGGLFTLSITWPHVEHRYCRWRWDGDGLEIHRGVYWRHRVSVPISRIQHVDVSQGPIQRQFGLSTITIHTAGTNEASIELSGLAHETATWLRDQLMAQQGTSDAV